MHRASELLYATPTANEGPYADPYRALPVKLHRAREAFIARVRATLQAHDLSDPQWRVLRILSAVDEIDLSELASRSMLLGPSLSRILKDLEARKLMTRRTCEKDGRRFLASITGEGKSLIATVSPQLNPIFQQLHGEIDATQIRDLNSLLDKVILSLTE